jgi:hypothetical protein
MPDDDRFLDFITHQLDLSGLDERRRLTDAEIEQTVMPLIRGDIHAETLRVVAALLRSPQSDSQGDHCRQQLAPFHREIRQCLAQTVGALMEHRYPNRLSADEWLDAASFIITISWLVRKQMDGDDSAE